MLEEEETIPASTEDGVNSKSITCYNIPEALFDKKLAREHFAQFGTVTQVILRPKQHSCTVEYETVEDAETAILDAGLYENDSFEIHFTPVDVPRKLPKSLVYDGLDPDVQSELIAMGGQGSRTSPNSVKSRLGVEQGSSGGSQFRPQRPLHEMEPPQQQKLPKPKVPDIVTPTKTLSVSDQLIKQELEAILKKPAFTSEEKFQALDARDKLIRLTTIRTIDIKTVKSIQGVCPDMCPEKERLMREAKHQVATFEFEKDSRSLMNHSIAIKQYSRSSADQEVPLPHDLRPEPVLKMTMNYLLHKIIDLCDDPDTNISDWFHFVWDRTRSIRKDITQQELCSQGSVALIEQCARFHIHCAARLCAEEPQVFDQKINTENLTKCLQSLKYMYHDLRLKGEWCRNEAEFRAYIILLNLNDSNFLWEVKQLPAAMVRSPEIQFAIQVYLTVESNNYVKFFRLVRETTYLKACLLLRYFNQIRLRAIRTIVKSYLSPRGPVNLSLSYITYILAFEDGEQCEDYLKCHGIQCDMETDRIVVERTSFYFPDEPYVLDRSINIVEHKRICSIGEIVYAGPLDSLDKFLKHVPHDSFDDNGYLWPEAFTVEDQNYLKPPTPRQRTPNLPRTDENVFKIPTVSPAIFTSPISKQLPVSTSIFQQSRSIFGGTTTGGPITPPTTSIFGNSKPPEPTKIFGDGSIFKNAFNQTIKSVNSEFGKTMFGGKKFFESTPLPDDLMNEPKPFFDTSTSPISIVSSGDSSDVPIKTNQTDSVAGIVPLPTVVDNEMETRRKELVVLEDEKRRLEDELNEMKREKEAERKRRKVAKEEKKLEEEREKERKEADKLRREQIDRAAEQLQNDIINEFIGEYLTEQIDELIEYQRQIEQLSNEMFEDLYNEISESMIKQMIEERIRKEQIIENTAVWIPTTEPIEPLPQQQLTLDMKRRYRIGNSTAIHIDLSPHRQIDIFQTFESTVTDRIKRKIMFWKCVISIPDAVEDEMNQKRMERWLSKTIRGSRTDSNCFFNKFHQSDDCELKIGICLRKLSGHKMLTESNEIPTETDFEGTSSILFFVSQQSNFKSILKRIDAVWNIFRGQLPFGIILYNSSSTDSNVTTIEMLTDWLIGQQLSVGQHLFIGGSIVAQTETALQSIIRSFEPPTTDYESQSIIPLLERCLLDDFWTRIQISCQNNPILFTTQTNLNFLINLHNSAVDKLIEMLTIDGSSMIPFPPELQKYRTERKSTQYLVENINYKPERWNDNDFKEINRFLIELKIKYIRDDRFESNDRTTDDLKLAVHDLVKQTIGSGSIDKCAYQIMEQILRQSKDGPISWIGSIRILITERLNNIYKKCNENLPNRLIYDRKKLKNYLSEPWWLEIDPTQIHFIVDDETIDLFKEPEQKRIKIDNLTIDIDEMLTIGEQSLVKANRMIEKYETIALKNYDPREYQLIEQICKCEQRIRSTKRLINEYFT